MLEISAETSQALRAAVYNAAARAEVRQAIAEIYARLQAAIDLRRPRCVASGRCCHFEEFGHRLFVTTAELAAFVYDLNFGPHRVDGVAAPSQCDGSGCPFQQSRLCGVHAFRPFGCRIFFCDQTSTDWQQECYERFHLELKALHERLAVPYFYAEWIAALRAVLALPI